MRLPSNSRVFLSLCAVVFLFASCSGDGSDSLLEKATGTGTVKSHVVKLPDQIIGLKVVPEKVDKEVLKVDRPYIDGIGVFSLRENDLLRATLQVSHLNSVARPKSKAFKDSVIGLMGSSTPIEIQVGKVTVYNTAGNKQSLFVWFEERGFFVLSIHEDYEFPRTLLRRVVELEPPV